MAAMQYSAHFTCEHCGKWAHRRIGGANQKKGYASRWCSMWCKEAWYAEHPTKPPFSAVHFNTCKQCGKAWAARRATSLCSDECKREFARVDASKRYVEQFAAEVALREPRRCVECGQAFAPIKRSKFCSDRCSVAVHGSSGAGNVRKKYGMSLREWQRVRLMVFRRDEYRCYLCDEATDPSADVNGDAYPNAEHVVPVGKGGPTVMANLRCAHRACNMRKSDAAVSL